MKREDMELEEKIALAAELIAEADGLLVTAGAGMGIDSGLPDFRGGRGFWGAYPALGNIGMRFHEIANPAAFRRLPLTAWGFYGHRLKMYRDTAPHDGFRILLEWARKMPCGAFVYTSNVDGQFQKAGFDDARVLECHGSIHWLQCMRGCRGDIWTAAAFEPVIDECECRLTSEPPSCPSCGGLARPNILMFGDGDWLDTRFAQQEARLQAWLARAQRPVVLEIGAGTSIPTVRIFGEEQGCPLIRINPREHDVASIRQVGIPLNGKEALERIAAAMEGHCGLE